MGSRPGSLINLSSQIPDLSFSSTFDTPVKSSPDRYRRPAQKRVDSNGAAPKTSSPQQGSAQPSGSGMATVSHLYQPPPQMQRQQSVDDMAAQKSKDELAKRYRRRSLNNLETQNLAAPGQAGLQRPSSAHATGATSTPTTIRPVSFHSQASSDDGQSLLRSASSNSVPKVEQARESIRSQENAKPAQKIVNVPSRGSSADPNKRSAAPSPLSKQTVESDERAASPNKFKTYTATAQAAVASTTSPAAAQLAALSDKDLNKGMKSRLRRAFSFGSSQEMRRAAGENQQAASAAQQAKELHLSLIHI